MLPVVLILPLLLPPLKALDTGRTPGLPPGAAAACVHEAAVFEVAVTAFTITSTRHDVSYDCTYTLHVCSVHAVRTHAL
jgi:hypothetical protein